MKTTFFFLFLAVSSFAQIKIADQKGRSYYDEVVGYCVGKTPTASDLQALKTTTAVPATFMDTLQKYDWYSLGGYHFYDKDYVDNFEQEKSNQSQYHFFRVMPDNKVANFSLSRNVQNEISITTVAFDKNTATSHSYKKMGNYHCIEENAYGEKTYMTIVSFKDGILVVDVPMSGKAGSTESKRFRNVYRAVPKGFSWDW